MTQPGHHHHFGTAPLKMLAFRKTKTFVSTKTILLNIIGLQIRNKFHLMNQLIYLFSGLVTVLTSEYLNISPFNCFLANDYFQEQHYIDIETNLYV